MLIYEDKPENVFFCKSLVNITDSRLTYDNVLKRLVVNEDESYYGLEVAGAEEPPIFACRFAEASGFEQILALANENGRVAIQV